MSRDDRDQRGGHKGRYWVSDKNHGEFTRLIRRQVRAKVQQALRRGVEPLPEYKVQHEYWD